MLRQTVSPTYARAPWIAASDAPANDTPTYAHAPWIARVRFFACFHAISLETRENCHVNIHLLVVHNPLIPLIGRLVACSARTRADRQTTVTLAAHVRRRLITLTFYGRFVVDSTEGALVKCRSIAIINIKT